MDRCRMHQSERREAGTGGPQPCPLPLEIPEGIIFKRAREHDLHKAVRRLCGERVPHKRYLSSGGDVGRTKQQLQLSIQWTGLKTLMLIRNHRLVKAAAPLGHPPNGIPRCKGRHTYIPGTNSSPIQG